jgi:hypothetical protein
MVRARQYLLGGYHIYIEDRGLVVVLYTHTHTHDSRVSGYFQKLNYRSESINSRFLIASTVTTCELKNTNSRIQTINILSI